jgi:uncharacterized phosphosugar-binding protein
MNPHPEVDGRPHATPALDGRPAPLRYSELAIQTLHHIEETQIGAIDEAVSRCAAVIGTGGLVHLFGSGHSRIVVEEMFPRYGSFAGFHPIVEHALSNYHQVVGANGLRQVMFIENVEELGRVILSNFRLDPALDVMIVVSSGGTNAVPIEVALEAHRRGLFVIAITSLKHSREASSRHSCGRRLYEVADLVIDTCTPIGDAGVSVAGLDTPVGPLSTVAAVTIGNMIKVGVAQTLTEAGRPPSVMTSPALVGTARADTLFRECFDAFSDARRRL